MTLCVALIDGPMYAGLYSFFDDVDVKIVARADHPTLNRVVAEMLEAGERIDVLSTHSKYAPSQRRWLRPLNGTINLDGLAEQAVALCEFQGVQYCVPRNIDVRVLWANRSLIDIDHGQVVPATWPELAASGLAFGFPGRESGLFGTLFEIVTAFGGSMFDDDLQPMLDTAVTRDAIECLRVIGSHAPDDLPSWHYDDVDSALGDGRVTLAAAWPGGTANLRASRVASDLRPFRYFGGAKGVRSYAGCHAWAIPITSGDPEGAAELVDSLCEYEAHALDARSGSVCAHVQAFADAHVLDEVDAQRRAITADTIADGMITYPPMERFPEVEDAGWSAVREVLVGRLTVGDAARAMQSAAEAVLR